MSLSSDEDDDDESSDSSRGYLVPPAKVDLDSSFFRGTSKFDKSKKSAIVEDDSSSDDSDEFVGQTDEHIDSNALLAEVLRNLEKANANHEDAATVSGSAEQAAAAAAEPKEKEKNRLSDEITNLLLQGESGTSSAGTFVTDERVEEQQRPAEYEIPKEGVDITLPGTAMMAFGRRQKRGQKLEELLRKRMNQRLRSNQVYIHKVGLLCWLAHGFHLNAAVNDVQVLSTALSLVAPTNYPKGRVDLKYLEQVTKWFRGFIKIEFKQVVQEPVVTKETLLERLTQRKVHNYREMVLLFAATLRAIGLNCRLVVSLSAPALKLNKDQLFKNPAGVVDNDDDKSKTETKKGKVAAKGKREASKSSRAEESPPTKKAAAANTGESMQNAKVEARKRAANVLAKFANNRNKKSIKSLMIKDDEGGQDAPSPRKLRSRTIQQSKNQVEVKESSPEKRGRATKSCKTETITDSEEEFEAKPPMKRKKKKDDSAEEFFESNGKSTKRKCWKMSTTRLKKEQRDSIDRRVLSSDEESAELVDAKGAQNMWLEVYVESEESWISVSVVDDKIHCVGEIYKKAPKPVLYVVAWNSVASLKDVTRRYCPHWLTVTRKQRVDESWWIETLSPWMEKSDALSRAEDEMLLQRELEQPLPKTVGECKGHPLYALARHLLKFEAIYPPESVPLGHLKTGEAIFSRHCVHTLCSRETWIKKARVVKPAQDAYKIVKSMPKYDKLSGMKLPEQPLELFGKWQTTQYVPPVAKDGKVPRNEYGNVDLFQACMLPTGTVHINLPALNRVARKLNIDCVPAVVGFNFGARGALPAIEGYVVCEEFEETLRAAWQQDQIESAKRANDKREKRIYGNWKKLIKGLFIRERLAARYDFNDNDEEEDDDDDEAKPSVSTKRKKVKGSRR